MEQVIGGYIVESSDGFFVIVRQDAANDEIDDHAPHLAQKFRDGHELVRIVRLLDHGVLAEGFECRPGRGPYEVRSSDAGVPEVAELLRDIFAHFIEHNVVPAGGGNGTLLADDPDGG